MRVDFIGLGHMGIGMAANLLAAGHTLTVYNRTPAKAEPLIAKGERVMAPIPAAVFRVNEKDRAWVDGLCTPHPLASMAEPIRLTGARERIAKKAYVRATAYPSPSFDAAAERTRADKAWRSYALACGHDVMIDMPERLAEILVEVA